MSQPPSRVVYDCNVYAQALINLNGPAARCIRAAREKIVSLFVSQYIFAEIRELHEKLPKKYGVTEKDGEDLVQSVASFATIVSEIVEVYLHPIDPDDSHYINLAAGVEAKLIVSRDRHLLNLMDRSRLDAQEFYLLFPSMHIIDPVELLRELDESTKR